MVAKTSLSKYEIERNKPTPSLNHGYVQNNITGVLFPFRNKYTVVSEVKLKLSPDQLESIPDISIFPPISIDFGNDQIAVTVPPTTAVEILSPTQSFVELIEKAKTYFKYEVKSCWIVVPALKNIFVFYSPDDYQMFRHTEELYDKHLDLTLALKEIFFER